MKWAVFNQKGGVGKTSLTSNLAACMASQGRKVLVVDLDSQCNSSGYLLGDLFKPDGHTVGDFFESTLSFKIFKNSLVDAIQATKYPNLFVIPSSGDLGELQTKLEGRYKIKKLSEAIDAICQTHKFDEVIFDTPPALNFFSMSALIASDRVLIPFDCDAFSAEAVTNVMNVVDEVSADHKPDLDVEGVIINQFQKSAKLPQKSIDSLAKQGLKILTPYLSSSVVMRESHGAGVPLPYFRSNHKLTLEFQELAKKLISSSKKHSKPEKMNAKKSQSKQASVRSKSGHAAEL